MTRHHKYSVGQNVRVMPSGWGKPPSGTFEILRLLPLEEGEFLYRVRSKVERTERVVAENLLAV